MFWTLYLITCIVTVLLALKYELTRPLNLLLINAIFPPFGLLYTLYIVYVVRPRLLAEAQGIPEPVPFFVPYLEKLRTLLLRFWAYILSLLGRTPPKID